MVSLILPYWDRQAAADRALAHLDANYRDENLEVVIVDDGNAVPFRLPPHIQLNTQVVRMPVKPAPTPQSKAWNAGVMVSSGDIIVLSCIEVIHEVPVLGEMLRRFLELPQPCCVLAAAWCPDFREWHCHSTHRVEYCPPGTGPTFLSMMYRSTFDHVGGFDEDYMEGAGYEDKDFIMRLTRSGVTFHIQDDLIVLHPKAGASIRWPGYGFDKNLQIFKRKWLK